MFVAGRCRPGRWRRAGRGRSRGCSGRGASATAGQWTPRCPGWPLRWRTRSPASLPARGRSPRRGARSWGGGPRAAANRRGAGRGRPTEVRSRTWACERVRTVGPVVAAMPALSAAGVGDLARLRARAARAMGRGATRGVSSVQRRRRLASPDYSWCCCPGRRAARGAGQPRLTAGLAGLVSHRLAGGDRGSAAGGGAVAIRRLGRVSGERRRALAFCCAALGSRLGLVAAPLPGRRARRRRAAGEVAAGDLGSCHPDSRRWRFRRAGAAAPRDLEARIAAAGRPWRAGTTRADGAKTAGCVRRRAGRSSALQRRARRLGVVLVAVARWAAFWLRICGLLRRASERSRRVRRELPSLLDLLRLSIEAGRSLPVALREVGARTRGPLATEWRTAGREVTLGLPLDQALRGMAERAPLPEVRALVAALERARRHGAPLAETLAAQRATLARGALSAREEGPGPGRRSSWGGTASRALVLAVGAAALSPRWSRAAGGRIVAPHLSTVAAVLSTTPLRRLRFDGEWRLSAAASPLRARTRCGARHPMFPLRGFGKTLMGIEMVRRIGRRRPFAPLSGPIGLVEESPILRRGACRRSPHSPLACRPTVAVSSRRSRRCSTPLADFPLVAERARAPAIPSRVRAEAAGWTGEAANAGAESSLPFAQR